jgi:threonine/homoserine/homoserine lactone efflux protein
MPSSHAFAVFIPAALVLLAIPGPAVLYVVATSVDGGRRNGLLSVAGVHLGSLVHVAAAVAGLSALIVSSAIAFSAVKYVGAAYLVFLGIRALAGSGDGGESGIVRTRSHRRLYLDGVMVGALNPKLALFLLAFLPQFVHPAAGPVWLQTLVLGLIFNVIACIGDSLFALAAASAGGRLRTWLRSRRLAQASGIVYLGLGAAAALSQGEAKG